MNDHRARLASVLGARAWDHETARVRALGWDFAIRTDVPGLGAHLDHLFAAMAGPGEATHRYSIVAEPRDGWTRVRLYRDTWRVLDTPDPRRALQHLLWDINQQVFRSTKDKLLLHAAVLEHLGRGLLLSAPSGSGKSTLATGLVRRGLGYLSDEAAAVDPTTLLVHAYAKPVALEPGAQRLLPELRPEHDARIDAYVGGPWHLSPDDLRPGAASTEPVEPAWIVVPTFVAGAATRLEPLSRAEALTLLLEQSLTVDLRRDGFERLAELVAGCRCARLTMGELAGACDAVLEMLDG